MTLTIEEFIAIIYSLFQQAQRCNDLAVHARVLKYKDEERSQLRQAKKFKNTALKLHSFMNEAFGVSPSELLLPAKGQKVISMEVTRVKRKKGKKT